MRFRIGQRFRTIDGKLHAEIVQTFDEARGGVLVISDDEGNVVDQCTLVAVSFYQSGKWQEVT